MTTLISIAASLPPVFAFLAIFIAMDSYKLIPVRAILTAIGAGCLSALLAFSINITMLRFTGLSTQLLVTSLGPLVEELCKAIYIVILLRRARIGFLIDAALYGFAVGAGFSLIENVYYLQALSTPNILVWLIRGFGTAIMHGGVTAIFALIGKHLADQHPAWAVKGLIPAWLLAAVMHAAFNQAFFSPVIMTGLVLLIVPAFFMFVFSKSEQATRRWLQEGLDSDIEMLSMIFEEGIEETHLGRYLASIQSRFTGEVMGDMLCLLGINLEISMRVKGMLMMREAGVEVPPDPELAEKVREIEFLRKSIGATGMLTLKPFLPHSARELWQFTVVGGPKTA